MTTETEVWSDGNFWLQDQRRDANKSKNNND